MLPLQRSSTLILQLMTGTRNRPPPAPLTGLHFGKDQLCAHRSARPAASFRMVPAAHAPGIPGRLPPVAPTEQILAEPHAPSGQCGQILCTKFREIKVFLGEPQKGDLPGSGSWAAIQIEKGMGRCTPSSRVGLVKRFQGGLIIVGTLTDVHQMRMISERPQKLQLTEPTEGPVCMD